MKPQFQFYFDDAPQYRAIDSREYTANMLRAYRAHRDRYELNRVGMHHYQVMHGTTLATIKVQS
jgi:hypothetical protein